MTIDAAGVIHLAYVIRSGLDNALVYERRALEDVIESETVLIRPNLGTQVSLVLDAFEVPSLVFVEDETLTVARPGEPNWETEPMVQASSGVAIRHRVAASGDLHVLVRESRIGSTLAYGRFSNGVWSDEQAFVLLSSGRPALALDAGGAPAVVARGSGDDALALWRYGEGTWSEERAFQWE
jgi:hypothetical protein